MEDKTQKDKIAEALIERITTLEAENKKLKEEKKEKETKKKDNIYADILGQ